jgi:hypothetical protein
VFVELKPGLNNKDIFSVEYIHQWKIKLRPPKHERDVVECANCKIYGHTENTATSIRDASNAQATILQTSATKKRI